jgi:hypothetical protein
VFDHSKGELIRTEVFEHVEPAMAAYEEVEGQYRRDALVEVVLIGSDSLETVKITHANYFDGSVAISKYLVGL